MTIPKCRPANHRSLAVDGAIQSLVLYGSIIMRGQISVSSRPSGLGVCEFRGSWMNWSVSKKQPVRPEYDPGQLGCNKAQARKSDTVVAEWYEAEVFVQSPRRQVVF